MIHSQLMIYHRLLPEREEGMGAERVLLGTRTGSCTTTGHAERRGTAPVASAMRVPTPHAAGQSP